MRESNIGDMLVSKSSLDVAYNLVEKLDINQAIMLGYYEKWCTLSP